MIKIGITMAMIIIIIIYHINNMMINKPERQGCNWCWWGGGGAPSHISYFGKGHVSK